MGKLSERAEVERATPTTAAMKKVLFDLVEQNPNIAKTLPKAMDVERFKRMLLIAANGNPELLKCDPASFIQAGVTCAVLGLEPQDPRGLAYLVPYRDKDRGKIVNLIVGYRGMIELARRSGQVKAIHAHVVYDYDDFDFEFGLTPRIHHRPNLDGDEDPKRITFAYAWANVDGEPQAEIMSRKQLLKARDVNRGGGGSNFSPWAEGNWFAEMCTKTVLRRLLKKLPQSPQMADVLDQDERGEPINVGDVSRPAEHFVEDHDALTVGAPAGVDTETGEVIDVAEVGTPEEAAEIAKHYEADDPERPF